MEVQGRQRSCSLWQLAELKGLRISGSNATVPRSQRRWLRGDAGEGPRL